YLATPEKHFLRHQLSRNKYIKLLSYPGGPIIEKLAKFGNPVSINFPKPYMLDSWDFSFSGLKTSVLYFLQNKKLKFTEQLLFDICASFQKTIVDTLVTKTLFAVEKTQCRNICISGGVSANKYLRKQFTQIAKQNNLQIYFPKLKLSTDNAAMIASAGLKFFISSYRNTN
ncbi:MAG: hypothetical protein NZ839_00660, partial [Endomicrobia bacterium]|nr:hypothetical protein [Endomicrobiia bacterium]